MNFAAAIFKLTNREILQTQWYCWYFYTFQVIYIVYNLLNYPLLSRNFGVYS